MLWGILTRYIFVQPATWTTELSTLAFAWLTFFGAAYAFRINAHIGIDAVTSRLPDAWQPAIALIKLVVELGLLLVLLGLSIWISLQSGARPSPVLRVNYAVVYGGVSVAILLMIVNYVLAVRSRTTTPTETNVL